jgi:hypothetical protein
MRSGRRAAVSVVGSAVPAASTIGVTVSHPAQLHRISFHAELDVATKPPGPCRAFAAQRRWEPSGADPVHVLVPRGRRGGAGCDRLGRVDQERLKEVLAAAVDLSLAWVADSAGL